MVGGISAVESLKRFCTSSPTASLVESVTKIPFKDFITLLISVSDSHISFENKDYYIELGLNIAFYRKRAGMTQDMLAEKANLSTFFASPALL